MDSLINIPHLILHGNFAHAQAMDPPAFAPDAYATSAALICLPKKACGIQVYLHEVLHLKFCTQSNNVSTKEKQKNTSDTSI